MPGRIATRVLGVAGDYPGVVNVTLAAVVAVRAMIAHFVIAAISPGKVLSANAAPGDVSQLFRLY